MAITFFDHSEGSIRKPFIEAYVTANPTCVGKEFYATEVSRTRKQTGYMVHTDAFSIFLFEDAKITSHLLQALQLYVSTHKGYELIIVPSDKSPYYAIGVDENKRATWLYGAGKYTVAVQTGADSEQQGLNPFLPSPTQMATASTKSKRNLPTG